MPVILELEEKLLRDRMPMLAYAFREDAVAERIKGAWRATLQTERLVPSSPPRLTRSPTASPTRSPKPTALWRNSGARARTCEPCSRPLRGRATTSMSRCNNSRCQRCDSTPTQLPQRWIFCGHFQRPVGPRCLRPDASQRWGGADAHLEEFILQCFHQLR